MKTYDDLLRRMIDELKNKKFMLASAGRIREIGTYRCPLEVFTQVPLYSFNTYMNLLQYDEGYDYYDLMLIIYAADNRRDCFEFSIAIRQDLLTACGLMTDD